MYGSNLAISNFYNIVFVKVGKLKIKGNCPMLLLFPKLTGTCIKTSTKLFYYPNDLALARTLFSRAPICRESLILLLISLNSAFFGQKKQKRGFG